MDLSRLPESMSVPFPASLAFLRRLVDSALSGGILLSLIHIFVQFASAQAVANYFGSLSEEASMASMYFSGYVNTTSLPDKIFFARYNGEAVGAWLRGAKYTGNIAVLQSVTNGAMVISIDNTPHTLSSVDL